MIQRLEVGYFPGNSASHSLGIEKRYGPDSAAAAQERFPEGLKTDSVRRENAHPGDYNTITLKHGFNWESDSEGKADILVITLNPVITFFRPRLSTLFTKFSTYSQVASCVVGKNFSSSTKPSRPGGTLLYTLSAVQP